MAEVDDEERMIQLAVFFI